MSAGRQGGVLVGVLWICGLVAWVAFMINADQRLKGEEDLLALGRLQGLHLAVGGVNEALARMTGQAPDRLAAGDAAVWRPDGQAREVRYPKGRALVSVEAESSKVDVNMADAAALVRVFRRAGLEADQAEILADRVVDFRDGDDATGKSGMEKEDYRRMGLDYLPLDESLASLDQLLLVPGVTPDLFLHGAEPRAVSGQGDRLPAPGPGILGAAQPGRPLGSLLTVRPGGQTRLAEDKDGQDVPEAPSGTSRTLGPEEKSFTGGGTYRIISVGRASDKAPAVTLWVVVGLSGKGKGGYEIVSRKVW